MLDLESVRLFVLSVEFGSFTRAAEAAGTVQPVVSQRVKALEAMLGRKLLERTPRFVRTTEDGAAFLARARELLALHDASLKFADDPPVRFTLGASDHALGLGAETILRKLRSALPSGAVIDVRISLSQTIREMFDAGQLDAAIIRREAHGSEGETLGIDLLGWRADAGWSVPAGSPVPLATLPAPCGVRAAAIKLLDRHKIPWREAFVGGSCAALLAGVRAGLGVAPMGRLASGGVADAGPALGLPELPPSELVLFARASSPAIANAIRALAAAVKAEIA
jgi:DNA-binding transcriptional LysR family regulator